MEEKKGKKGGKKRVDDVDKWLVTLKERRE